MCRPARTHETRSVSTLVKVQFSPSVFCRAGCGTRTSIGASHRHRSAPEPAIATFPELLRHNPFDRLLIAQARRERLDLLTADKLLIAGGYGFVVTQ